MKLAKVIGTVVCSIKDPSLHGMKLLVIQPLTDEMQLDGDPLVAVDTAKAGPGDLVWWILSREACLALPEPFSPVDAAITGIVDDVTMLDPGIKHRDEIFSKG
ncbi:MAG: EutN/CcmL family microcompartment protein [Bdellovibrio sp.]|nr:EutN/CcmL family microcompartment protein [Bdellovibrio sp.]